ncbi:UNVERIFIED_CONTAM: hypothetical protein K2H54_012911 [Gekko kuhli]
MMQETQAPPGASGKCREKLGQRKQQASLAGVSQLLASESPYPLGGGGGHKDGTQQENWSPAKDEPHDVRTATTVMAEEMLQHHVIGEEACQESVGEGARERPLGRDTPEEVCPLLSQSQGETLQCRANELQQRDQGGEEEAPRDSRRRAAEGDADEASASGSPQDFWPPRGEKHPVPLEVVVTVVDSLYSLESVEQRAGSPPNPGPGSPGEGGSLAHDSCHLTEDEDLPRDSPVSTGYYPCFRTSSLLPQDQPGERDPGKADASTQAGGTRHDKASQWEADPSGEEARTKPRPGRRSPLPSPEQASEGESKVRVSPLQPKRQVLGGLGNGDSGTPRTGLEEGRREHASESRHSAPFPHS